MKKLFVVLLAVVLIISGLMVAKGDSYKNEDLIRIHIRANSESEEDGKLLVLVKEQVIGSMSDELVNCKDKKEAYKLVKSSLSRLEKEANCVLKEGGANYKARITLREEEFPSRQYLSYTLKQGVYDSLTIELGKGGGDSWWCVAFPPICFSSENKDYHYKSRLEELIQKYLS